MYNEFKVLQMPFDDSTPSMAIMKAKIFFICTYVRVQQICQQN